MGSQRGRAFGQRGLRGGEQRESVEETLDRFGRGRGEFIRWTPSVVKRCNCWAAWQPPKDMVQTPKASLGSLQPKPLTPSKSQNPKALNPQIPLVPKPLNPKPYRSQEK